MKNRTLKSILSALALICFAAFISDASEATKNSLRVGTSKVMITPKTPIPMAGYSGRKGPFKGVHDDLYSRVIVLSDGINKAALITNEIIGHSAAFWDEITTHIEKETGIKKDYILLSAIHTHSGPAININSESAPEVIAYVEELKAKIVSATKEAMNNMVDAQIGAGKGECKMNMNRRAMNGKGGVDLGLNPYAPCDHEVGVIRIDDKTGKNLALMMNWPCHAVVLGPRSYQITNDWPGAASNFTEKGLGQNVVAPVLVGASGDINPLYGPHIDYDDYSAYSFGREAVGEDLANVSMAVMKNIKTYSAGNISAIQREISLPSKPRTNRPPDPNQKDDGTTKIRLSALKIGNIILTGVSGEVFNQISVQMRKQSPYEYTFMASHCNGSSGYLVTEDSYNPEGKSSYADKTHPTGGYEPNSTRVKTGAEKAIIENLLEMINEL